VKVVNATGSVQPIHITVNGISGIQPNGKTVVLTSGSPQDTNTLSNPEKVVPSTRPAHGMGNDFNFIRPEFGDRAQDWSAFLAGKQTVESGQCPAPGAALAKAGAAAGLGK
jgi:hypothetical protein